MPPRNTQRGRQAAPPSAKSSHTLLSESIREPPPMNRQEVNVPPPAPRAKRFEQLRKLGATPFVGTINPTEADRVFDLMQCTDEEKYDYAMFLLQGDAYNWWKTVPLSIVRLPVLTWEDFLREYHEKYTPAIYKREKHREFVSLEQGNMSVAEYAQRFTQL